jgi:protein-S-isoprenylcysteine O-methyltransferase Ste14
LSEQFTLSVLGLIGVVPLHFWSVEHEMLHERFGREMGRKVGEALGLLSGWGFFLFSIGVWLSPQPRFSLLSAVSSEVVILGAHLYLSPVNAALAIPFLAAGGWLGVKGVAEVSLKVAETHRTDRVVTTGAYSMVRHPQYLGGVLSHVGVSLLLSAWYSLLMTPIVGVLYYLLSWKEEQELVKEFGGEYMKYQGEVPMIIPKLRSS